MIVICGRILFCGHIIYHLTPYMIFQVFAPASVRAIFPHLFGLSTKRSPDVEGIDRRALLTLSVAMVWLLTMVLVYLSPLMLVPTVRPLHP